MLSEKSVLNPKATFQLLYSNFQAKREIWPRSRMPGPTFCSSFFFLITQVEGSKQNGYYGGFRHMGGSHRMKAKHTIRQDLSQRHILCT